MQLRNLQQQIFTKVSLLANTSIQDYTHTHTYAALHVTLRTVIYYFNSKYFLACLHTAFAILLDTFNERGIHFANAFLVCMFPVILSYTVKMKL